MVFTAHQNKQRLLSLPAKIGGLAIPIFSELSDQEFKNSVRVTKPSSNAILERRHVLDDYNQVKTSRRRSGLLK